jgi:hypothetical protein
MIVADLDATRKHLQILALDKAVEAQFIEQCEHGSCVPWRGIEETEPIDTAPGTCACVSGHVAAPPRSVMNLRRFS